MDDFIKSVKTDKEAIEVFSNVVNCLKNGGFDLRKWISNSSAVMKSIPSDLLSEAKTKTFEIEPLNSSILGLKWNVDGDSKNLCRMWLTKEPSCHMFHRCSTLSVSLHPKT